MHPDIIKVWLESNDCTLEMLVEDPAKVDYTNIFSALTGIGPRERSLHSSIAGINRGWFVHDLPRYGLLEDLDVERALGVVEPYVAKKLKEYTTTHAEASQGPQSPGTADLKHLERQIRRHEQFLAFLATGKKKEALQYFVHCYS